MESYCSVAGFDWGLAAVACWETQTWDPLPHLVPNQTANSQFLISSCGRAQIQRSSRSQLSSAPSWGCSQTKVTGLSQVGDRGVGCPFAPIPSPGTFADGQGAAPVGWLAQDAFDGHLPHEFKALIAHEGQGLSWQVEALIENLVPVFWQSWVITGQRLLS